MMITWLLYSPCVPSVSLWFLLTWTLTLNFLCVRLCIWLLQLTCRLSFGRLVVKCVRTGDRHTALKSTGVVTDSALCRGVVLLTF